MDNKMEIEEILASIVKEREHQIKKWGNDFDNHNTINDWVSYICHYATKANMEAGDFIAAENYLIKTAALCVAALEASGRNDGFPKRHYD